MRHTAAAALIFSHELLTEWWCCDVVLTYSVLTYSVLTNSVLTNSVLTYSVLTYSVLTYSVGRMVVHTGGVASGWKNKVRRSYPSFNGCVTVANCVTTVFEYSNVWMFDLLLKSYYRHYPHIAAIILVLSPLCSHIPSPPQCDTNSFDEDGVGLYRIRGNQENNVVCTQVCPSVLAEDTWLLMPTTHTYIISYYAIVWLFDWNVSFSCVAFYLAWCCAGWMSLLYLNGHYCHLFIAIVFSRWRKRRLSWTHVTLSCWLTTTTTRSMSGASVCSE